LSTVVDGRTDFCLRGLTFLVQGLIRMNSRLTDGSAVLPPLDGLAVSSTRASDPVLDLHSLRRRCQGNEAFVGQILTKLTVAVLGEHEQLRAACQRHDFAAAAKIAHRLKGTAANVEATALRQAAEQLEAAARGEDAPALAQAVLHFEQECRRLAESVARYHET
jgi:HPt (histidine-containing phosphotransfer) domain-containing protein